MLTVKLENLEKLLEEKLSWAIEAKRMSSIEDLDNEKYAKEMISNNYLDSIVYEDLIGECFGLMIKLEKAIEKCSSTKRSELLFNGRLANLNKTLKLIDLECDVTFDEIIDEIKENEREEEETMIDNNVEETKTTEEETEMNTTTTNKGEGAMDTTTTTTTNEGAKEMNTKETINTTKEENKMKEGNLKEFKGLDDFISDKSKSLEEIKLQEREAFVKQVKEKEKLCLEYRDWLLANIDKVKNVRILTNFHIGNPEVFKEAFTKTLFIASNGGIKAQTEGFDFQQNQLNSLSVSNYIGKAVNFNEKSASKISLPQVGLELANSDLYTKLLVEKPKKIKIKGEEVLKESVLKGVIENKHLLDDTKELNVKAEGYIFDEIVKLANKYGVKVNSMAKLVKVGETEFKYARLTKVNSELILPLVEFIKINDIDVIKWGLDIYAGSLMVDYPKERKFLNCKEVLLNLFESYIKNMENEEEQNATSIIFDSKERKEDKASLFVRVESLDKMFAHYNEEKGEYENLTWDIIKEVMDEEGKEIDDFLRENRMFVINSRKANTLCGNCHGASHLIFDVLVNNKNLQVGPKDEIIKTSHGETLGGGAGNTGLLYRVVNTKNALLLSAEDKVSANLFSCIFGISKASRMNNPTSLFITKKGTLTISNCYNQMIDNHFKVISTAFVNSYQYDVTGKVMMKDALKGYKISNVLDKYFSTMDRHKYFSTLTGEEDRWTYLLKHIGEDLKESVKGAYIKVEEIKKSDLSLEEKIREIRNVQKSYKDLRYLTENQFNALLRKVKRDVKQRVEKISVDLLKGDMVFLNKENIKFVGENLSEKETAFINETLVVSNKIGHKREIADGMFLHNDIRKQVLNGAEEFSVVQPEITEEPKVEDLIDGKLVINGYEFACKLKYTSMNLHDHKNNYVSQGANCDKEFLFNIQDINSTIAYGRALGIKNSRDLNLAYASSNRELKKGKLVELSLEEMKGLKVQVTLNPLSKEFKLFEEELKFYGMEPVRNEDEADIIQGGSLFYADKTMVMDKGFRVLQFVFDENGDKTVLVKRERKYFTMEELETFNLSEEKILFKRELDEKITTKVGVQTKGQILSLLSSRDLATISIAVPELKGTKINGNRVKGLLESLSPITALEVDNNKFIIIDKTMKNITRFLPKELTVALKLINEINEFKANRRNEEIVDLILEGKIEKLEDFFNVFKDSEEAFLSRIGFIKTEVKRLKGFDIEHNIPCKNSKDFCYVIRTEQKNQIVDMTISLNQLIKFQEEKLFTKSAKKLLSEAKAGFYGTLLAGHYNQWEVRVNPNSDGFKQFEIFKNKFVLSGAFPVTGEKGLGLVLKLDEDVPENCIVMHPFMMEQLMRDTDGDTGYTLFLSENYCKRFTALTCDETKYAKIYEEKGWFKKAYNKDGSYKPTDLSYEGTLARHEEYRNQSLFNPRFVGTITSNCMFYADIVYKFFVESFKNNPEDAEKLKAGKAVYEFYIRVVQKQLSQIPIAAKNTSPEDLEAFARLWDAFNRGELGLDELGSFIDVTGWDNQEQVVNGTVLEAYEAWLETHKEEEENN